MKKADGWMIDGNPEQYEIGVDEETIHNESPGLTIKFNAAEEPSEFGSLCKKLDVEKFLDKRLRMTAFVKTEHVDGAGLWMRVDGEGAPLAFDNMFTRQIKNTTDWKRYEVVLDVPGKASQIWYGALLTGKGQMWVADFNFEEVGNDVATTIKKTRKTAGRAG
ncbi:MAG TPA: hypothetical protein V6C89_18920 [Drouetiella sp.]|jgi:hypothetical protein